MPQIMIDNTQTFISLLQENKKICAFFSATWWGPCKTIGPQFETMANDAEYENINFVKIDVDKNQELTAACKVQAMPTFISFDGGQAISGFAGGDQNALKKMLGDLKTGTPPAKV